MRVPVPYVTYGNRIHLLSDGDAAHETIIRAIEHARERVWLEVYIFEPDRSGFEVLDALTRAAGRGCDVLLMIDRFGAKRLRDKHVQPLRAAGGAAYWFNPLFEFRRSGKKVTPFGVHRDHRKVVVIDTGLAYTGGQNVSMQYGGPGEADFYDLMVEIEGPAARGLAAVFLETLEDTTELKRALPEAGPAYADGVRLDVLTLDLREEQSNYEDVLVEAIRSAEREVLFATPYLLPPRSVKNALLDQADRGVDVRILTAGKCDNPWVRTAARHQYEHLLLGGIRLYEVWDTMLHAKLCTVDRARGVLGSYNVDIWNRHYNQEVGVAFWDEALGEDLARHFFEGTDLGCEITLEAVRGWSKPAQWMHALTYYAAVALT